MDLVIIVAFSVLLVPVTFFGPELLRTILGAIFILFAPGYTFISAIFPRRGDLGGVDRIALGVGLSIAIATILGFLLNYTPWRLGLHPILIFVLGFVIIMAAIAWRQRRNLPPAERVSPGFGLWKPSAQLWAGRSRGWKTTAILLTLAVVGITGTLAYAIAAPKPAEKFTEFYILGASGKVADYPTKLSVGQEGKVTLGIVNRETESVSYQIKVNINGEEKNRLEPIVLADGEKWEGAVSFVPDRAGSSTRVEFLLYRDGGAEPYAKPLYLWVDVTDKG